MAVGAVHIRKEDHCVARLMEWIAVLWWQSRQHTGDSWPVSSDASVYFVCICLALVTARLID